MSKSDSVLFFWAPENSTSSYIENKTRNRMVVEVGSLVNIRVFSKSK